MKNLGLLFTFILAGGIALAQTNESEIVQASESNTATVNQVSPSAYAANSTMSVVNQQGKKNVASVDQQHTGALEARTGSLEAYIDQLGNENTATQIQGPHSQQGATLARIIQGGNKNSAYQIQVKYGNSAEIEQAGSNNVATQAQDIDLPADAEGSFNTALINQLGDGNTANQQQNGWANGAEIFQSGSNNLATQNQDAWVSTALIDQSGWNNVASQEQVGKLNVATIDQEADKGTATQTQTSSGARGSAVYDALNEAEIFQLAGGKNNEAIQVQCMPSGVAVDILPNFATATQDGMNNWSSQDQKGGNNSSSVMQTGSSHSATLTQSQTIVQ